jgi:multiple sugar transport system substrate-binding protein
MLITTTDPAKVKAVWEYMKFLTGPEGQSFAVQNSGYLPTNAKTPTEEYLGRYYRENPYFATPSTGVERAAYYAGYPGTQSERIWREQRDIIHSVMIGEIAIPEGAKRLAEITSNLMTR